MAAGSSEAGLSPYGAMSDVMCDHVYVPGKSIQIYTSPCIVARVSTPFDVLVGITACRQPIAVEAGGATVTGNALVAGARERRLEAKNVKLVIVQLDPFHPAYSLLRGHHTALRLDREAFAPFDKHLDAAYQGTLSLADSQGLSAEVVQQLQRQLPGVSELDSRVLKAMEWLYENPRISVDELASKNGLSYDRMSHLFIDELGISIRSLQVWVKLHRALVGIRHGQSLVELAEIAGFSDAAHLSRVYKQVYGAPPSYFYYSGNVKLVASFAGEIPGPRPGPERSRGGGSRNEPFD
jgi:AraC family transcriptional regulator, arabinose operon regulatory protein